MMMKGSELIIQPYLSFWERISQIVFNQYTILLIISVLKLHIFSMMLVKDLIIAKNHSQQVVAMADQALQLAREIPYKTTEALNLLTIHIVNKSIVLLYNGLMMIVKALSSIIIFIINFYIGTITCLITLTVQGAVDVGVDTSESVIKFVNTTISGIANKLDDGLEDISKVLSTVVNTVDHVIDKIKGDDDDNESKVHNVNLTIDKLRNIHIPGSVTEKLDNLKKKVPNFDEVEQKMKDMINIPFNEIKYKITNSSSYLKASNNTLFNKSILYVPPSPQSYYSNNSKINNSSQIIPIYNGTDSNKIPVMGQMSSYAQSEELDKFYDKLSKDINKLSKILIIILIIFAFIVLIPIIYEEIRRFIRINGMADNFMKSHLKNSIINENEKEGENNLFKTISSQTLNNNNNNEINQIPKLKVEVIEVIEYTLSPFQRILVSIIQPLIKNKSIQIQNLIKWGISWCFSTKLLTILGLGLAGVIIVLFQFLILQIVTKSIPKLIHIIHDLGENKSQQLSQDLNLWSNITNNALNSTQTDINHEFFGWIDHASLGINNTLTTFMTGMDSNLDKFLGDTILNHAIKGIIDCLIGNKIEKIQNGLTWVYDNARITLPRIDPDLFLNIIDNNNTNSTIINGTTLSNRTIHYKRYIRSIKHTKISKFTNSNQNQNQIMLENTANILKSGLISVIKSFKSQIKMELYFSLVLIILWVFSSLIGMIRVYIKWRRINNGIDKIDLREFKIPKYTISKPILPQYGSDKFNRNFQVQGKKKSEEKEKEKVIAIVSDMKKKMIDKLKIRTHDHRGRSMDSKMPAAGASLSNKEKRNQEQKHAMATENPFLD